MTPQAQNARKRGKRLLQHALKQLDKPIIVIIKSWGDVVNLIHKLDEYKQAQVNVKVEYQNIVLTEKMKEEFIKLNPEIPFTIEKKKEGAKK